MDTIIAIVLGVPIVLLILFVFASGIGTAIQQREEPTKGVMHLKPKNITIGAVILMIVMAIINVLTS